ncbi:MAG: hypothetical protein ACJAYB_000089 [Psychromonas sp.]|jgi:uncharacterized protein YkvS
MATTSFNKNFVVTDQTSIKNLAKDLLTPHKIVINKRDYQTDKVKGIELLKQRLLSLKAC